MSTTGSQAAITVRGVVRAFGEKRAVDGTDPTVPSGTAYGPPGHNGADRTTFVAAPAARWRTAR